jgi:hypothetical protein
MLLTSTLVAIWIATWLQCRFMPHHVIKMACSAKSILTALPMKYSMTWKHSHSLTKKRNSATAMVIMLWDCEGILMCEFLPPKSKN